MQPQDIQRALSHTFEELQARAGDKQPHARKVVCELPNVRTCTHVFIRAPPIKKSLQPQYQGPYEVLDRSQTCCTVMKNGKKDTVAWERLKPAYLPKQSPENNDTISNSPDSHAVTLNNARTLTQPTAQALPARVDDEVIATHTAPPAPTISRSGRRSRTPAALSDFELYLLQVSPKAEALALRGLAPLPTVAGVAEVIGEL